MAKIKTVTCKSGIKGWQTTLQNNYGTFEEFSSYSELFNIAERLGFSSAEEAWAKNPLIQGSVNPSDLMVVA